MKISGINTISTLLLLFLFCRLSVSASAIRFDERGVLECETFSAGIVHRDRGWNSTEQRKLSAAAERISQNNGEKFRFPFHGFQAEQTVTRLGDNRYRLTYSLTSSGNIETNSIYFLMVSHCKTPGLRGPGFLPRVQHIGRVCHQAVRGICQRGIF